jgi:hypothetical protein
MQQAFADVWDINLFSSCKEMLDKGPTAVEMNLTRISLIRWYAVVMNWNLMPFARHRLLSARENAAMLYRSS